MKTKERDLWVGGSAYGKGIHIIDGWGHEVGVVDVEIIEGNVVITVDREDESLFGPVSLVVR